MDLLRGHDHRPQGAEAEGLSRNRDQGGGQSQVAQAGY